VEEAECARVLVDSGIGVGNVDGLNEACDGRIG